MSRALDATQAELVRRSHIAPVTLVKLTTYTDRVAETVDKVFYLSTLPCEYDYGNEGTDRIFLPVISGGSDFISGTAHLPSPDDLAAFSQTLDVRFSNLPINGSPFVSILQAHNLEGARIEVSQLLLESIGPLPLDLTAHVGDEHTVLFRGRVNRVTAITQFLFTIECRPDLPSMADEWIYATDETKVDPIDVGKRFPRIYGKAKHTPVVSFETGWVTTFVDAIDATEDNVVKEITDGSGLPTSGTFVIKVDEEHLTCSTATATTVKIDTGGRGADSTTAAIHEPGGLAVEIITTATYIVSDQQSDALPEVYVINPLSGALLRLDPVATPFTTNLSDMTTISGRTVTSIQFSAAQLETLLEYFKAQQPTFEGGKDVFNGYFGAFSSLQQIDDANALPFGSGQIAQRSEHSGSTSVPTFTHSAVTGDRDGVYAWMPTGLLPNADREVDRFRIILVGSSIGSTNNFPFDVYINWDFGGAAQDTAITIPGNDPLAVGRTFVGDWDTPPAGTLVSDFERSTTPDDAGDNNETMACYIRSTINGNDTGSATFDLPNSFIQFELKGQPTVRNIDSLGASVLVGNGLQFFADCDGVEAPDATYDAAIGAVLVHPADILKHWIVEVGGESIDSASYDALVTSLGASAEWGFDARGMGLTWEGVLQRMAFEARCNVIPVEKATGREWKLLAANNGYGWGTTTDVIGQTHSMLDVGRGLDGIAAHFNYRYAFDAAIGGQESDEEFKLALLATPDVSDVPITTTLINDAAQRFGDLIAEPISFRAIQDTATAQDVAGYITQERMANDRRVYRLEAVAWFDALPHDVGDIVSIQAPWSAAAVTCRLIAMQKAFDSHVWTLEAVEVLSTGLRT